jgi:hypothetical protein
LTLPSVKTLDQEALCLVSEKKLDKETFFA